MDPQIKRRMVWDVTVFPCTGTVDGSKQFGDPFILKGYADLKFGFFVDRQGQAHAMDGKVYFDETAVGKINPEDELQILYSKRYPIQHIQPFVGLNSDVQLLEVYI